jgi:hypothetical protein
MIRTRLTVTLAVAACAAAFAACGDDPAPKAAPGSPDNPLTATQPGEVSAPSAAGGDDDTQEAAAQVPAGEPATGAKADEAAPNFKDLVDEQAAAPQHRFTPCNLVTAREAAEIVGAPMRLPVEAPQGPTCIYRPRAGDALVALAIQDLAFGQIKGRIKQLREVDVSDERTAYCGTHGQPVLYVPLGEDRVLSVNADCDIARRFATKALPHL